MTFILSLFVKLLGVSSSWPWRNLYGGGGAEGQRGGAPRGSLLVRTDSAACGKAKQGLTDRQRGGTLICTRENRR